MKLSTLIWIALALILMGFIGQLVAGDAGYVVLQYDAWRIEMSLWVFLVFLVTAYATIRCIAWVLTRHVWFNQFVDWRSQRAINNADAALQSAVLAYLDERYPQAEKLFGKAALGSNAWLASMMSARSAWMQGQLNTALHYLDRGKEQAPNLSLLFELQRIEYLRDHGKLEQAQAIAKKLAEKHSKNGYVTKQLVALAVSLKDGPSIMSVMPRLLGTPLPGRKSERQRLFGTLTEQMPDWLSDVLDEKQQKQLSQLWYQLDKKARAKPELVMTIVRLLAAQGANKQAIAILRHALKQQPSDELLVLYSEVLDEPEQQLQDLDVLLKTDSDNAAALFSAGRLCLTLQLWGRAKDYLTRSLALKDTMSVRLALLSLAKATNDNAEQQRQEDALLAPQLKALGL